MNAYGYIGSVCLLIIVLLILKTAVPWLYKNLIGPKLFGPRVDLCRMGKWAIVTGSTDGIGKAYAKALAKKGINLILISRSIDKLTKTSDEIKKTSPIQIITIDVDFTHGPEIYDKIRETIGNLEIGTLVNNVGMSYDYPEYFLCVPNGDQVFRNLLSCNIGAVTFMTKLILPQMVERKKGTIINISSLTALLPSPLLCVYAGTKAYIDKFSCDLHTEYKDQGIIVQSILPGPVATNMIKSINQASWMVPSSDTFVASALKSLGVTTRTIGYFAHSIIKLSVDIVRALTCASVINVITVKSMKYERKNAKKYITIEHCNT